MTYTSESGFGYSIEELFSWCLELSCELDIEPPEESVTHEILSIWLLELFEAAEELFTNDSETVLANVARDVLPHPRPETEVLATQFFALIQAEESKKSLISEGNMSSNVKLMEDPAKDNSKAKVLVTNVYLFGKAAAAHPVTRLVALLLLAYFAPDIRRYTDDGLKYANLKPGTALEELQKKAQKTDVFDLSNELIEVRDGYLKARNAFENASVEISRGKRKTLERKMDAAREKYELYYTAYAPKIRGTCPDGLVPVAQELRNEALSQPVDE